MTDSNSTNGTFVNELRIGGRQRLNSNDVVRIGWNEFRFIDEEEQALEKTAYILD
ncbi:MAG: FHA domain-containing protein [Pseudomonadota bacterium]|nr:FHA domain-containing protein [Pseudomonadota bacterium]